MIGVAGNSQGGHKSRSHGVMEYFDNQNNDTIGPNLANGLWPHEMDPHLFKLWTSEMDIS